MEGMNNQLMAGMQQQQQHQPIVEQQEQQQQNAQQQQDVQQQQQQPVAQAHIEIVNFQENYAPEQDIVMPDRLVQIPHFVEPIQIPPHVIIEDYEGQQHAQVQQQNVQEQEQQQQQELEQQLDEADIVVWGERVEEIKKAAEELQSYGEQLNELRQDGKISVEQQARRLEAILRVRGELSEADMFLLRDHQETMQAYQNARAFLVNLKRPANPPELDPGSPYAHLTAIGKEGEILPRGAADEAVSEQLSAADHWLLSANLKQDAALENSLVFNLFNRPAQERLLAYYLIEKGYQTKLSDSEILFFNDPVYLARLGKREYQPNVEQLQRSGLDMEKLAQVYRTICLAGPRMQMMRTLDGHIDRERQDDENGARQADENVELIQEQIAVIRTKLYALEDYKMAYDNGNWFQKLRLKSSLKKAVTELYDAVNDFFLIGIHIPGNEEISNVQDYIKDVLLAGNGLKTLGSGAAGLMKGVQSLGAATAITNTSTNILGCVLGGVNFLIAAMGILKASKGFASLTTAAKISQIAEWCNSLATPISATASSVTSTVNVFTPVTDMAQKAALKTAGTAMAGLGLAVGLGTTVVGGYQLGNAFKQGKNAQKAKAQLEEARKARYENDVLVRPAIQVEPGQCLTEQNIFKIQERINKRAKISAACLTVSGVCAMTASAALLTNNHLVALGAGAVGLLTIAGGTIATQIMKRGEYEKAVDEYLDLDTLVEERITERQAVLNARRKKLSNSEKKKLKKQLRADMMEMMGFTSVKSFYINIMQNYARHICTVVYPEIVRLDGLNEAEMNDEAKAFYKLVESMGLKWKFSRNADNGSIIIQPKVELIAKKLMG